MKKDVLYRSCVLRRKAKSGIQTQFCWIPERYAVVDKVLTLKMEDGRLSRGWIVQYAGKVRTEAATIRRMERTAKNHRSTTDI